MRITGTGSKIMVLSDYRILKPPTALLFKIRRTPFGPLALVAFGYIFHLAVFEKGLHPDFTPAGAKELLRGF
ncbi:MAG: hypothetical protein LBI86_07485 [Treponema sp.]|jgi:hypothetical protein|nr:hypothetical protein [Treponema sp.]